MYSLLHVLCIAFAALGLGGGATYYLIKRKAARRSDQFRLEVASTVLDSLPGLTSVIDSQYRYLLVSQNLAAQLGVAEQSLLGREIGWRGKNEEFGKRVRNFMESPDQDTNFLSYVDFGAGLSVYEIHMTKRAIPGCIVTYSNDITRLRNLEQELSEKREIINNTANLAAIGAISQGLAQEIEVRLVRIMKCGGDIKSDVENIASLAPQERELLLTHIEKLKKSTDQLAQLNKKILGSLKGSV